MIVLLLGAATVAAFVRVGNDDGGSRLAQTGPGTTVASTSTTSTSVTATTSTTAPASVTTGGTGGTAATTPPATTGSTGSATTAPATNEGGSGLGAGGAGEVAMGPTIPNTGIESALAPGVALLGAGVGLRMLLAGRRPHDA